MQTLSGKISNFISNIPGFRTIKSKIIIFVITLVSLPILVITYHSYTSMNDVFNANIVESLRIVNHSYNNTIMELKRKGFSYGELFMSDYSIKAAVSHAVTSGDNSSLLNVLEMYYITFALSSIEFIDKRGIVLARGHLPEKYYDSKMELQFTKKMIEEQGELWDYKLTERGVELKFGSPIFDDKGFMGFVEYGYYINDNFLLSIKRIVNAELILILNNKNIGISASTTGEITQDNINIELLKDSFNNIDSIELGKNIDNKMYSLLYLPVLNTEKKVFASIIVLKDIGKEVAVQNSNIRLSVIILIISFTVGVALSIFIVLEFVAKPVKLIVDRFRDISEGEGDLTIRLDESSRDELRELSSCFNKFISRIYDVVTDVKDLSIQLSSSTHEMSSSTISFSDNAQSQSASAEEMTATIGEVSAGIDNIADGADDQFSSLSSFIDKMNELSVIINEMGAKIKETLDVTEDIFGKAKLGEESLKDMNNSMTKITDSSNKMSNVIQIINDISEKINLLSLNAAIEAARAGDAGRGFAVVSDEISKLADATASSIKEIDNFIKLNNDEINRGMGNISNTVKLIGTIIEGFNSINSMMNEIYEHMQKQQEANQAVNKNAGVVRNKSDEIKRLTEEQKTAISEIVNSINSINELTQSNASGAEELASTSEEVTGITEMLKSRVNFFKV